MLQVCLFPHSIWNICNLQIVVQHTVCLQSLIEVWVGVLVKHLKQCHLNFKLWPWTRFCAVKIGQYHWRAVQNLSWSNDLNAQGWYRRVCIQLQILQPLSQMLNIRVPYASWRIISIVDNQGALESKLYAKVEDTSYTDGSVDHTATERIKEAYMEKQEELNVCVFWLSCLRICILLSCDNHWSNKSHVLLDSVLVTSQFVPFRVGRNPPATPCSSPTFIVFASFRLGSARHPRSVCASVVVAKIKLVLAQPAPHFERDGRQQATSWWVSWTSTKVVES